MKTERDLKLKDVFVAAREPRQARKEEHDLVEMLVVAVVAVLCGADTLIEKKTAIPPLLSVLALEGCIVTIDAMDAQPSIARAIRERGAPTACWR